MAGLRFPPGNGSLIGWKLVGEPPIFPREWVASKGETGWRSLRRFTQRVRPRVRGGWLGKPPIVPIRSCTTIGPGEGPERLG